MPISTPVPIYATTASEGNNAGGEPIRRLTGTSPGATDSTATTLPAASLLSVSRGYLIGEQAARSSAYSGSGLYRNIGWCLTPAQAVASGLRANAGDSHRFSAGTWTLAIHYSRPGGLLTGNVPITCNVNIYRIASPTAGSALQHIGAGSASFTVTTSEASTNINISGAQVEFGPDECLMLEIHVETPAAATSDTSRFHTNSTTALRFSAVPAYVKIPSITATSAGVTTAAGSAGQVQGAVAESSGVAAASAIVAQAQAVVGASEGSSLADANAARVLPVVASADGAATVSGAAAQTQAIAGSADGVAGVAGAAANVQAVVGGADGSAQAQGVGGVVVGTIASSAGAASAAARIAKVIGTVGTIEVGAGGSGPAEPYPDGLLRLRPDGRVEAVRAGTGPLPPGALQRVVSLP